MKPSDTKYRILDPQRDRQKLREFYSSMDQGTPRKWGWPTIVAERGEELLGVLGVYKGKDAIQVGPMVLKEENPFVALRLIEAMENLFRTIGVILYLFSVEKDNLKMVRAVEKIGFKLYRRTRTKYWYIRNVHEQSIG